MLDGYEKVREEFASFGFSIIAGTVDNEEETLKVAEPLGFPIAHSMTRANGDAIGAWWDEGRDHIQPTEFIINKAGGIMASTYSNSPLGRIDPQEALTLMKAILTKSGQH